MPARRLSVWPSDNSVAHLTCIYIYTFNHPWYQILTHLPLDKMAAILRHDNFKCIFFNENDSIPIPIRISLTFLPKRPIDNKPALVQLMAGRRTGDKPLPELMLTHFTDAYMRHYREMSFDQLEQLLLPFCKERISAFRILYNEQGSCASD